MKKAGFLLLALSILAIHSSLCEEAGAPSRRVAFVRDSTVENHWPLGLVNADEGGFQFQRLPSGDLGWWSVTWAPDGKSIFCQDLEKICRFSVEGE